MDAQRLLDNAMRTGIKRRIWQFKLTRKRLSRLLAYIRTGKLTCEVLFKEFPWLCLHLDKAASQWSMWQFLAYHEKCLVVCLWDPPCHGAYNGVKKGLKESGHISLYQELGILSNWKSGGWNQCTHLHKMNGLAVDFFDTIDEDDVLLDKIFAWIDEDQDLGGQSREMKREWLQKNKMKAQKQSMRKGEQCRMAQWFGWSRAMVWVLANWGSMFLFFAYLGVLLGHVKKASQLFGEVTSTRTEIQPQDEPPPPPPPADGAADGASSSSSSGPQAQAAANPDPNHITRKGGPAPPPVKKVDIKKLREKAKTTLLFVLEILASRYLRYLTNMIFIVIEPLWVEHRQCLVYLRSAARVQFAYG